MSTGYIGSPSGNVIVPITNFTKKTKQVALTLASLPGGWSTTKAVGIFYADSNNVWRMQFNIEGNFSTVTVSSITLNISGVTFSTTQAITGWFGSSSSPNVAYAGGGSGQLAIGLNASVSVSAVYFSGDVELSAEPTTYTILANMENSPNVAAYFPNYAPGTQGLVPSTGLPGQTSGLAIASGNIGQVLTQTCSATAATSSGSAFQIGSSLSLPAGVWLVNGTGYLSPGSIVANTYFYFDVNSSVAIRAPGALLASTSGGTMTAGGASGPLIVNSSGATTVYAVGQYNYSSISTSASTGNITAIRIA